MPEGELLSPGDMDVLNPFNADEEAFRVLQESAVTMLENALAIGDQTLGLNAFATASSDEGTDSGLSGKLSGTLAGIDGEAFTVQDADGTLYTFFFSETFPRSAFDQSLDYGSPISVSYEGKFDEYGQFSGVFAVSDGLESSRDGGD